MPTPLEQGDKHAHGRRIAVIGLGYAGLTLAAAFGRYSGIVGFDADASRVTELKNGCDRNHELSKSELDASSMTLTADANDVSSCDFYIIVVPTPVTAVKQPNLEYLIAATKTVGSRLKKGDIVVYESTVYPGATEELCIPILEQESGLVSPTDFGVGYSPERISCGDPSLSLHNTVKVISGQDQKTVEIVRQVYSNVVEAGLWEASSIRVAEAAKLVENTQRDVNVALMNEFAIIFDGMGISTREVLQAAGTKHNFAPFTPGLVGGHCVSVDPYYVLHKAEGAKLIALSRSINDSMPGFIVERTIEQLRARRLWTSNARVGVLGITFKENFGDIRESRSSDIVAKLRQYDLRPLVHDPVAKPQDARTVYGIDLCAWNELRELSAVIVTVAHDCFRALTPDQLREILIPGGLLIDVKGLYDPSQFNGHDIQFWQL